MDYNYDDCIVMLLHHEGGYVNHPKDLAVKLIWELRREFTRSIWVERLLVTR